MVSLSWFVLPSNGTLGTGVTYDSSTATPRYGVAAAATDPGGGTLQLRWAGVPVPAGGATVAGVELDVEVTVVYVPGSGRATWSGKVAKRRSSGDLCVLSMTLPALRLRFKPEEGDRLFLPERFGAVSDCVGTGKDSNHRGLAFGNCTSATNLGPNGGDTTMGFAAVLRRPSVSSPQTYTGLYIGAHDGASRLKALTRRVDGGRADLAWMHLPIDMLQPLGQSSGAIFEYDVVTQSFSGDWRRRSTASGC